jgi:hypothetical protein
MESSYRESDPKDAEIRALRAKVTELQQPSLFTRALQLKSTYPVWPYLLAIMISIPLFGASFNYMMALDDVAYCWASAGTFLVIALLLIIALAISTYGKT